MEFLLTPSDAGRQTRMKPWRQKQVGSGPRHDIGGIVAGARRCRDRGERVKDSADGVRHVQNSERSQTPLRRRTRRRRVPTRRNLLPPATRSCHPPPENKSRQPGQHAVLTLPRDKVTAQRKKKYQTAMTIPIRIKHPQPSPSSFFLGLDGLWERTF